MIPQKQSHPDDNSIHLTSLSDRQTEGFLSPDQRFKFQEQLPVGHFLTLINSGKLSHQQ